MVENGTKLSELIDKNAPKPKGFVSADDLLTAHRMVYDSDTLVKTSHGSERVRLPDPGESIRKRNARVFGKTPAPKSIRQQIREEV